MGISEPKGRFAKRFLAKKLVRWRAARLLAETGTKEALPSQEKIKEDPEFEVRIEVEAAIHHITEGSKAALSGWKLMSQDP